MQVRTVESEIKANIEFWAHMGIEVDSAEVEVKFKHLPELDGYDWYFFIPKGVKISQVWCEIRRVYGAFSELKDLDSIEMSRTTEESYAIKARRTKTFSYAQPRQRELKSEDRCSWLRVFPRTCMTILEVLVAELRQTWDKEDDCGHLFITYTESQTSEGKTVCYTYNLSHYGLVFLDEDRVGDDSTGYQVITKDTDLSEIVGMKRSYMDHLYEESR